MGMCPASPLSLCFPLCSSIVIFPLLLLSDRLGLTITQHTGSQWFSHAPTPVTQSTLTGQYSVAWPWQSHSFVVGRRRARPGGLRNCAWTDSDSHFSAMAFPLTHRWKEVPLSVAVHLCALAISLAGRKLAVTLLWAQLDLEDPSFCMLFPPCTSIFIKGTRQAEGGALHCFLCATCCGNAAIMRTRSMQAGFPVQYYRNTSAG